MVIQMASRMLRKPVEDAGKGSEQEVRGCRSNREKVPNKPVITAGLKR
jgi:hypothetical protein